MTKREKELTEALRNLVEMCGHIPVIAAFGGSGSVLAIRRAGKYLDAFAKAKAVLEKEAA